MQRRAFLGGAAAAPLAGDMLARELTGHGIASGHRLSPMLDRRAQGPDGEAPGTRIRDWSTWWGKRREETVRDCQFVSRIDPDIAAMQSLPLNSKFVMQRRRNIEREMADQKNWFEKQIGLYDFVEFFE